MSFGWGSGDLVLAIQLSKDVYDALTESTDEYNAFSTWVRSLSSTLSLFQIYEKTEEQQLNAVLGSSYTSEEAAELHKIIPPLKGSVDKLLATVSKYLLLGTKPARISILDWFKRQGKKLQWGFLQRDDVRDQKNEASQYLSMLQSVVSARASRNVSLAISDLSDRTDANHRAIMRFAADTNERVTLTQEAVLKMTNVIWNSILASGEAPNIQPALGCRNPDTTSDAKKALQLLKFQIPSASSGINDQMNASVKIGFNLKDRFEQWLDIDTRQTCLWILDDNAIGFSQALVIARRKQKLPIVHYRCERFDTNGGRLEPEEILRRLTHSFLHQLLCYIIDQQLPMPATFDADLYRDLNQEPDSSMGAMALVSGLLLHCSRLIWVIDDFDRLEDDDIPQTKFHEKALEKLLTVIGASKAAQTSTKSMLVRRCLLATSSRSKLLLKRSFDEHLDMFVPGERADPKRYILVDELKSMMRQELPLSNDESITRV